MSARVLLQADEVGGSRLEHGVLGWPAAATRGESCRCWRQYDGWGAWPTGGHAPMALTCGLGTSRVGPADLGRATPEFSRPQRLMPERHQQPGRPSSRLEVRDVAKSPPRLQPMAAAAFLQSPRAESKLRTWIGAPALPAPSARSLLVAVSGRAPLVGQGRRLAPLGPSPVELACSQHHRHWMRYTAVDAIIAKTFELLHGSRRFIRVHEVGTFVWFPRRSCPAKQFDRKPAVTPARKVVSGRRLDTPS